VSGWRNIKLTLAYDGTNYHGWQRQQGQGSIQGVVEERIARMTGENMPLHGAGRTDAGVHALGMVANFHTRSPIPCPGFWKGLNGLLPGDIRVLQVEEAAPEFHARYQALGKRYVYNISLGAVPLPTARLYTVHVAADLDLTAMQACLAQLVGRHDFTSFAAAGADYPVAGRAKGAIRRIFSAKLGSGGRSPAQISIELTGDGFLRHMVRNIVGTLLEVGRGRRPVADFQRVMAARSRPAAGPTAPAHGLFLMEVYYEELPLL